MVNCMPVFIAREPYGRRPFEEAGCPSIGRGHQIAGRLMIMHSRADDALRPPICGVDLLHGTAAGRRRIDFLEHARGASASSRRRSRRRTRLRQCSTTISAPTTSSVACRTSCRGSPTASGRHPHGGPQFGDVPLNVELKLEVWDSPNLGGHRHRCRPTREARVE